MEEHTGMDEDWGEEGDDQLCMLCLKQISDSKLPNIINDALKRKYCNNLNNYFYLKDINRILNRERSKALVHLQEWNYGEYAHEMFKRFYQRSEYKDKLKRLWRHYSKAVDQPKVVLKEYDTALRRYFRYKRRKKQQRSYLFGHEREDPMQGNQVLVPFLVIEELRRAQKEEQAKNKPSGFEFERKLMPGHNISEICKPHRPTKAVEAEKSVAILENILKSVGKETRSVDSPSFLDGQSYTELSYIINGAEKLKEIKPQTPLPVFFDPGAGFKRKLEPKLIVKGNSTERLVGRSKSKESASKVGVDPAGNLEFKKGYKISSRAVDSGIAIKIGNGKVPEETNLESLKIVKKLR